MIKILLLLFWVNNCIIYYFIIYIIYIYIFFYNICADVYKYIDNKKY